MEEQMVDRTRALRDTKPVIPADRRTGWKDPQMTCKECQYNDQDIDTCPCARCHTRN